MPGLLLSWRRRPSTRLLVGAVLVVAPRSPVAAQVTPDSIAAGPRYARVAARLATFIDEEMRAKQLSAVSVALVDGADIVWARGFGVATPADHAPATARTRYAVGSLLGLFTEIAARRLADRDALALDASVRSLLPGFAPAGSARPITVTHLLTHRSGLVREPPVGGTTDTADVPLAATVRSLRTTRLAFPPGTRRKYSIAGLAVAGAVAEAAAREPFARVIEREVLDPTGLERTLTERRRRDTAAAAGSAWTLDGRITSVPSSPRAIWPAGGLELSVVQMATLAGRLLTGAPNATSLLTPASRARLLATATGPVDREAARRGGSPIARWRGEAQGFTSQIAVSPGDTMAIAVAIARDATPASADRIVDEGLRLLAAARRGEALGAGAVTSAVPLAMAQPIAGVYARGAHRVAIDVFDSTVTVTEDTATPHRARLLAGDTLVLDDALTFGARLGRLDTGRIVFRGETLTRVPVKEPPAPPTRWRGLIGEFGSSVRTAYVLERSGRLHLIVDNVHEFPLTEAARDSFVLPAAGRYAGESVVFARRPDGYATGMRIGGRALPRRPIQGEDGRTFRLQPVRPVTELRAEALAATPPAEPPTRRPPDLVELVHLDSTIRLDIRYAGTNNFLGTPMYSEPRAFLQRPAAEALVRVHRRLAAQGLGLLIHDAYRPWYVTKMFWDATPDTAKVFVADPSSGSRHNRGAAVDLTLFDRRTGRPVEMVSGYDEFSARAYPEYPGGTSRQRFHRALLRHAMEAEGFQVYEAEWWHFDYRDWRDYAIGNLTFDRIPAP